MFNPMNPVSSGIFTVTGMMQTINIPGITGQNKSLMCYTTGKGTSRCFEFSGTNAVKCKDDSCFVAYETLNQHIMSASNGIKRLGLDALIMPNGISTRVLLVGEIKRKSLKTLKRVIGPFKVEDVSTELPRLHDGFPQPPGKCHLNPLSSDCSIYLSSDDWSWIPGIGFKKSIEIATNPKTLLKSEAVPELKKIIESAKQLFKKPPMAATGAASGATSPMQSNSTEKPDALKTSAGSGSPFK